MPELNWNQLLSTQRLRPSAHSDHYGKDSVVVRSPFEADYDRIVGSSSVRRLQDKAQVFPLQEDDVARTRLTHSIEVSALARSLGKSVGKQLERQKVFNSEQTDDLAALLQVAGLIHDLGNPPFGHYGETAIRDWFTAWFKRTPIIDTGCIKLSKQQKEDFRYFDGNAQNWRIVTKLQTLNDNFGANFTYAVLGTIIKYPWRSDKRPDNADKFGYFYTEAVDAEKVREALGLSENVRHPATYLLEAADDIIYLCDDIEDGVKKGLIPWEHEYKNIKKTVLKEAPADRVKKLFTDIEAKGPDWKMPPKEQETARVRNFRNAVQSYLFQRTVEQFMGKYHDLMKNEAGDALIKLELLESDQDVKTICKELKRVAREYCFSCREVLSLESAGHHVISSLLDIYVSALIDNAGDRLANTKFYPGKLFYRISPNFVYAAMYDHLPKDMPDDYKLITAEHIDELDRYDRLRLIVDFIAGMTDSYALSLYQELTGIKRP